MWEAGGRGPPLDFKGKISLPSPDLSCKGSRSRFFVYTTLTCEYATAMRSSISKSTIHTINNILFLRCITTIHFSCWRAAPAYFACNGQRKRELAAFFLFFTRAPLSYNVNLYLWTVCFGVFLLQRLEYFNGIPLNGMQRNFYCFAKKDLFMNLFPLC